MLMTDRLRAGVEPSTLYRRISARGSAKGPSNIAATRSLSRRGQ
jgi:hypothetical protein